MRYISSYLPFILITLFLYGLFFSKHKEATIIEKPLINSGQQAVQVDFMASSTAENEIDVKDDIDSKNSVESNSIDVTEVVNEAKEIVTENELKEEVAEKLATTPLPTQDRAIKDPQIEQAEVKKEDEVTTPKIKITPKNNSGNEQPQTKPTLTSAQIQAESNASEIIPTKKIDEVETQRISAEKVIKEPLPPTTNTEAKVVSKTAEEIKTANDQLQKSIQETPAIIDATIKGAIFDERVKSESAAAVTPKTTQNIENTTTKSVKKSQPDTKKTDKPVFKKALKSDPETLIPSSENPGSLQEAIVVSGNKPVYPQQAILRNKEGRVVVTLTVTSKGKPKDAKITTSSGHDILDNAVIEFVNNELFMPALQGEDKVTSEQIFSFRFVLKE